MNSYLWIGFGIISCSVSLYQRPLVTNRRDKYFYFCWSSIMSPFYKKMKLYWNDSFKMVEVFCLRGGCKGNLLWRLYSASTKVSILECPQGESAVLECRPFCRQDWWITESVSLHIIYSHYLFFITRQVCIETLIAEFTLVRDSVLLHCFD